MYKKSTAAWMYPNYMKAKSGEESFQKKAEQIFLSLINVIFGNLKIPREQQKDEMCNRSPQRPGLITPRDLVRKTFPYVCFPV